MVTKIITMKTLTLILTCLVAFSFVGCASPNVKTAAETDKHDGFERRETIAYKWTAAGVLVTFYRQNNANAWTMTVRDSWDVIYQALSSGEKKAWDSTASKVSTEECLNIIEQSLLEFRREKPRAKLDSVDIEIQLIKPLWSDVLERLHQRLLAESGEKAPGRFEIPKPIEECVQDAVDESPATASIKTLLKKLGYDVRLVAMAEHIMFKDSLTGQKWTDIAKEPAVGILSPGMMELNIE